MESNVSLMVGKRVLQGYVWGIRGNGAIYPRHWRPFWQGNVRSQKYWNFLDFSIRAGFIQMIPCDVTACRGDYKRIVLGSQNNSSLLSDWDRLWSANAFEESLFGVLSAVRASKLLEAERIESAVAVLISELLSVCVANLSKFVFPVCVFRSICE
ncbi:hypothetical protein AVEN_72334-1 [Araneus ventricosus]|uniref:Uncharacterized protein n=1 Tax=Araneus ventricosus TaxID=182803 RepID=A0A4Y2SNN8_ARAVE|nr:hypothetical protein AVEN_72334-1 [Araneus ventricosus]